jgi:hypothetical protein
VEGEASGKEVTAAELWVRLGVDRGSEMGEIEIAEMGRERP